MSGGTYRRGLAYVAQVFDDPLLAPLRRLAGALIVAAGPWLVAIAGLTLVSGHLKSQLGHAATEDLRLAVVYAFALAPLAAAAPGMLAARSIARGGATRDLVRALFLVASGLGGAGGMALAALASAALGLGGLWLSLVFLTAASAVMWVGFAVLAALREHRYLVLVFCIGMALSFALAVLTAGGRPTVDRVLWSITTGVAACAGLLMARVSAAAGSAPDLAAGWTALRAEGRFSPALALGAVLAMLGVWADKLFYWFGPEGMRTASGLRHFADYDSVMFLAHLSVVPSLAALLALHEGPVRRGMARFLHALEARKTRAALREEVRSLSRLTLGGVQAILLVQLALSAAFILMAPMMLSGAGMRLDQYLLLRTGLLGAFVHAVFLAASAVLVLCNRKWHFLALQVLFLGANLGLSLFFYIVMGVTAYGFVFASFLSAAVAVPLAAAALENLDKLHLMVENDHIFSC
ncbi:MAG: exopolysaccharide Pel transporter PelG [Rhodosalinus sp.]